MAYDHDLSKSLHTTLVDSLAGYETALEKSDDAGLAAFLNGMVNMRRRHAEQLAASLERQGEAVTGNGSFMTLVHEAVINVRSLFGGLDDSALPGFLDGEERVLGKYEDALVEADSASGLRQTLLAQKEAVEGVVGELRSRVAASRR